MKIFPNMRSITVFFLLIIVVFGVDLWTKNWALLVIFNPPKTIMLTPFFNLAPVWNSGISFGLFASQPEMVKYAISAFAILVVIWLFFQLRSLGKIQQYGAGLIAGGALGNVYDRFRFGRVVDFLDFHLLDYHWPAFNIADSAIFIGVVLWLYGIMRASK